MKDNTKFNTANMKKVLNNIESARVSIAGRKNVTGGMQALKTAFNQLEPMMKNQVAYIKSLSTSQKQNKTQSEKAFESKRFIFKIIQIFKQQMNEYLQFAKKNFSLNKKQKKIEQGWQKIQNQMERKLNQLKDNANANNIFQILFRLLNARDALQRQYLKSLLYKKNNLWLDLNLPFEHYVHSQINSILNMIKQHKEKYAYIPTTIEFIGPNFEEEGRWRLNPNDHQQNSTIPTLFKIVSEDFDEMVQIIKNFSKLNETEQKFQDINKNQTIVKGLREKIQVLTINYNTLLQKYRSVQANSKSEQKTSSKELKQKIEELELIIAKKENQISGLKNSTQGTQSQIQTLKQKYKESQQELNRLQNSQSQKLSEIQSTQKRLSEDFSKLRKDIDTYSSLIQIESQTKMELLQQLKKQKETVQSLVNILGRERRTIKDLKLEIKKLDSLVMQLVDQNKLSK